MNTVECFFGLYEFYYCYTHYFFRYLATLRFVHDPLLKPAYFLYHINCTILSILNVNINFNYLYRPTTRSVPIGQFINTVKASLFASYCAYFSSAVEIFEVFFKYNWSVILLFPFVSAIIWFLITFNHSLFTLRDLLCLLLSSSAKNYTGLHTLFVSNYI